MSVAADIKPETPTGMIESRDEYRRARRRIEELVGARRETPEALELAALTAAVLDYEARLGTSPRAKVSRAAEPPAAQRQETQVRET